MGVIFRFFLLVETTQTLMPPFNRKAASVDEKLPKLPEFKCSQSLQGVEATLIPNVQPQGAVFKKGCFLVL